MKTKTKGKRVLSAVTSAFIAATYVLSAVPPALNAADELVQPMEAWGTNVSDDVVNDASEDGHGGRYPAVLLAGNNVLSPDGTQLVVKTDAATTLQNITDAYALGIASQFCVFINDDFKVTNADAEGRFAVGGNVNIATPDYGGGSKYAIGKGDFITKKDLRELIDNNGFAHIIMGGKLVGGKLEDTYYDADGEKNTDTPGKNNKIVVINESNIDVAREHLDKINAYSEGSAIGDRWRTISRTQVYPAKVFDFDEQFALLESRSIVLEDKAKKDGVRVTFATEEWHGDTYDVAVFDAAGKSGDTVYFYVDEADLDQFTDSTIMSFENIPNLATPRTVYATDGTAVKWETANIVVSIPATGDFKLKNSTKDAGAAFTRINGEFISKNPDQNKVEFNYLNNHEGCTSILYNIPHADTVHIVNNFQGTVFAPTSDVVGDQDGHLSGALVAQSFSGPTEFGFRPYAGGIEILGLESSYFVNVSKVDENGAALEGATMTLYQAATDERGNVIKDENGEPTLTAVASNVTADDLTKLSVPGVGVYCIKESQPPAGYSKTDTEYWFKVEEGPEARDVYYTVPVPDLVTANVYTTDDLISDTDNSITADSTVQDYITAGYVPAERTSVEYQFSFDLASPTDVSNLIWGDPSSPPSFQMPKLEFTNSDGTKTFENVEWGSGNYWHEFKGLSWTGGVTKIEFTLLDTDQQIDNMGGGRLFVNNNTTTLTVNKDVATSAVSKMPTKWYKVADSGVTKTVTAYVNNEATPTEVEATSTQQPDAKNDVAYKPVIVTYGDGCDLTDPTKVRKNVLDVPSNQYKIGDDIYTFAVDGGEIKQVYKNGETVDNDGFSLVQLRRGEAGDTIDEYVVMHDGKKLNPLIDLTPDEGYKFTNSKALYIKKVGEEGEPLAGANLTITKVELQPSNWYNYNRALNISLTTDALSYDTSDTVDFELSRSAEGKIADGIVAVMQNDTTTNIATNVYRISENTAPTGYQKTGDTILFFVKDGYLYTRQIMNYWERFGVVLYNAQGNIDRGWTKSAAPIADSEIADNTIQFKNSKSGDVHFNKVDFDKRDNQLTMDGENAVDASHNVPGAKMQLTLDEPFKAGVTLGSSPDGVTVTGAAESDGVAESNVDVENGIITWTTGTTKVNIENLPDGTYTLTELEAPAGYWLVNPYTFSIYDGEITEVTKDNERVTSKSKDPKDEASNATVTAVDRDFTFLIGKLAPEKTGPDKTWDKSIPGAVMELERVSEDVDLSKIDLKVQYYNGMGADVSTELNENVFTPDEQDERHIRWTTPADSIDVGKIVFCGMQPGDYVLREIKAPEGYAQADPIEFTIAYLPGNGGLAMTTKNGEQVAPITQVSMTDEHIFKVSKKELTGKVDAEGKAVYADIPKNEDETENAATFVLTALSENDTLIGKTIAGVTITADTAGYDATNKSYTFTGNNTEMIGLLEGGSYTLRESIAPNGYDIVESTFVFSIDSGKIVEDTQTTTGEYVVSEDGSTVTVLDKLADNTITISKAALGGETIADDNKAKFTLTSKTEGVDLGGVTINDGEAIAEGETSVAFDGNSAKFTGLKDGTYELEETVAPKGYTVVSTFTFEV
ncbi:MAG: choice-of-anchor A family protein, partial [Oscillospiraceae bacterium]|nr:choice-of-anchor A family protein [Oscillospiraceae bacterium]